VTWLRTAQGGYVKATSVVALEVEMRNFGRWYVDVYLDSGACFELLGESCTQDGASALAGAIVVDLEDEEN
jgi:hypothetical protein